MECKSRKVEEGGHARNYSLTQCLSKSSCMSEQFLHGKHGSSYHMSLNTTTLCSPEEYAASSIQKQANCSLQSPARHDFQAQPSIETRKVKQGVCSLWRRTCECVLWKCLAHPKIWQPFRTWHPYPCSSQPELELFDMHAHKSARCLHMHTRACTHTHTHTHTNVHTCTRAGTGRSP